LCEKFEAGEIGEDNFLYKLHKNNYEDFESRVETIKIRIADTKNEIQELQQSINDSYKTPQKEQSTPGEEDDNFSEMSEGECESINAFGTLDDVIGHAGVDIDGPVADEDVADAEDIE
jgi:hypothetical protein